MTVQDQLAPTAPALRGTSWALLRFTADGVTASLSSDMATTLSVETDGTVRVASGLLDAVGRLGESPGGVHVGDFAVAVPQGAMPAGTLEERIVRSCSGDFTAEFQGRVLRLRRDGITLDFLPRR